MREYGKVHTSFWSSADIRSMSEDARTLALYLLTCPHNSIIGAFRLPDGYACEDLQWSAERVAKGFAELLSKGFANRCETTKWVWINKHLQWNPPENPNQRKSAAKMTLQIPKECQWKQAFIEQNAAILELPDPPKPNPPETVPQPFLNQEQEQEQEQKQEKEQKDKPRAARAAPGPARPPDVAEQVWLDWLAHRKAKKATVTPTVIEGARSEAAKAGITLEAFLRIWCRRGTQGLEAAWLKPEEKAWGGNFPAAPRPTSLLDADEQVRTA